MMSLAVEDVGVSLAMFKLGTGSSSTGFALFISKKITPIMLFLFPSTKSAGCVGQVGPFQK
jgi:hypothetical protein